MNRIVLTTLVLAMGACAAARAQVNPPLSGAMAVAPPVAVPVPVAPAAPAAAADNAAPARPLVRQVDVPVAAPAPVPATTAAATDGLGTLTRALFAAQADGRRAAPELPMLGAVATASWDRYLQSFTHPIPEWFRERVEDQSGGGGSGN